MEEEESWSPLMEETRGAVQSPAVREDAERNRAETEAAVVQALLQSEAREEELRKEVQAVGLSVGDVCKIQGLVSKPQFNGMRATLVEWLAGKKQWIVTLEGEGRISVKPQNLWVNDGESGSVHLDAKDDPERDLLHEAEQLFRPGTLFVGDIVIPGMQREEAKVEYQLYVSRLLTDALGRSVIVGRHRGYGDEQACDLLLEVKGSGTDRYLQLKYSDHETACTGNVDLTEGTITGQVSQLMHGEDGFYFPSKDVTHIFSLRQAQRINRSITPAAISKTILFRSELIRSMESLVDSLEHWGRSFVGREPTEPYKVGPESLEVLKRLNWDRECGSGGVTEEFVNLAEEVCATLRRQAVLLNDIEFESLDGKRETFLRLQQQRICRRKAHVLTDSVLRKLEGVVESFQAVVTSLPMDRMARVKGMLQLEQAGAKVRYRLRQGYERFEQALKAAEARPSKATVRSWRKSVGSSAQSGLDEASEELCMICMTALDEGNEGGAKAGNDGADLSIKLPCGHCFHESCVSSWLHRNANCPNCRLDVSEKIDLSSQPPDAQGSGERLLWL